MVSLYYSKRNHQCSNTYHGCPLRTSITWYFSIKRLGRFYRVDKRTKVIEFYLLPSPTPYNIVLKAYAGSTEVMSYDIKEVTISKNHIESYKGELFGDNPNLTPIAITFIVNTDWEGTNYHEF